MSVAAIGFLLALGSAICWSSLDISRKELGRKMTASAAVAWLMFANLPYIVPMLAAGEFVETNPDDNPVKLLFLSGFPDIDPIYFLPAAGSIAINLLANFLYLRSVQISPLSLTTPYLSFTPVFTAITAFVALGQVPSLYGSIGIGIVCLGAFFMNPGNREDGPLAPLKALWTERGSLYMLVVAMLWSITPILDKTAAGYSSPLWHTMFLAAGVGTLFATARIYRDRGPAGLLSELKATPRVLAAAGLFAVGAMSLQLGSYAFIDVAYVETVKRALGVTSAILAGYFLFGERDIGRRLVGALVMSVGVALILLGG